MLTTEEKKDRFDEFKHILEAATKPVLVDFWAGGCPPCDAILPTLKKLEKDNEQIQFTKINLDEIGELVAPIYGIQGVPTIIIFENNKISSKIAVPNSQQLLDFVEDFMINN